MRFAADLDPAPPEPGHAGARQARHWSRAARTEGEHVQALVAGDQRVRRASGDVDDAVAGRHLAGLAVLPAESVSAEDVEDLLLGIVHVGRRGPPARLDLDAFEAGSDAPAGLAEVGPGGAHRADLDPPARDLVPPRDSARRHHVSSPSHAAGAHRRRSVHGRSLAEACLLYTSDAAD